METLSNDAPFNMPLMAGGAGLVVVATALWFCRSNHESRNNSPPLAKGVGLFDTVRAINRGQLANFLVEQFEKNGPIYRLPIPFPMLVVVANTEDARAIYKDPSHLKPPLLYKHVEELTHGPNINTMAGKEGDSWYHRRKSINKAFAPKIVRRMNEVALQKAEMWISQTLVQSQGKSFNAAQEMILLTIMVICKAAFDYDATQSDVKDMVHALKKGIEEFSFKTMVNPLRKCGTFVLADRREAYEEVAKIKKFAIKIIDNYRENPSPTPDTVIDVIMKNTDYKDDSERIPDIIMILFAGHDTTGYAMAFALLELARHQSEQKKLRENLSRDNTGGSYLEAVLNETMRMHPSAPLTGVKQMSCDFVTRDGYTIPKGSVVFIAQVALARDPTIFPDPNQFRPLRWLNADDRVKKSLFPFSLGKRNCVGQPLANAVLRSVLPRLLRQFEFTVEEEGTISMHATLQLENCYLKAKVVGCK